MTHATRPAVCALLAAAACGVPAEGDPATAQRDSAGVRIVESLRAAWGGASRWTVDPAPMLEIGAAEGSAAYQLDQVRGAVRLADGGVAVADGGSRELRFYDAEGRFLVAAGGEGGGPGEFASLDGLVAYRGDSVAAWDARQRRLSVFTRDGEFARAVTASPLDGVSASLRGAFSDGSFVVEPGPSLAEFVRRAPGERRDTAVYVRYAAGGALVDTLAVRADRELLARRQGLVVLQQTVLFGRDSYLAAAGDRAFVGESDAFRIDVVDTAGVPRMSIRRPGALRRVRAAELEAARAAARAEADDRDRRIAALAGVPPGSPRDGGLPARSTVPAFDRVVVDALGCLWVRGFAADPAAPTAWSVFDPAGRWLGTVEMPAGLSVWQIGPDWIVARARDALGVESVRVHRLTRA